MVTLKYQHFPRDKKAYARDPSDKKAYARDNESEGKAIVHKSEEKVVRARRE